MNFSVKNLVIILVELDYFWRIASSSCLLCFYSTKLILY